MNALSINAKEFELFRDCIERQCSISLGSDKKSLLESRLTRLVVESECGSFGEFYQHVARNGNPGIWDKIIDAMTTNETLWFRDEQPWIAFQESLLPDLARRVKETPSRGIRIWSAACSTGQEPYTITMLIDRYCKENPGLGISLEDFEIVATDISTSALFIAMAGRYDHVSMNRGLTGRWAGFKTEFFDKKGTVSILVPRVKRPVKFKRFNLQDSLTSLGKFDIILLRNVAIYFSDEFKTNLFERVERALNPRGYLFLGSTETLSGYTDVYDTQTHGRAIFYRKQGMENEYETNNPRGG